MKKFPIVKSRRLRSTPYTDRIEAHGVSSYTVYNHMLLPASFKSLESDYHHLKEFVQVGRSSRKTSRNYRKRFS